MATTLVIVLCLLQVADIVTTIMALGKPGTREANPIMARVFSAVGVLPGLLAVKGSLVALLLCAAPYLPVFVLVPLLALYVWVISNNVGVIRK